MNDLLKHNKSRWEAFARAGIEYSRPFLEITPEDALQKLDCDPVFLDSRFAHVLPLRKTNWRNHVKPRSRIRPLPQNHHQPTTPKYHI